MEQSQTYWYTVREDRLTTEDGNSYTGYGIEIWEVGKRINSIPDIFLHISCAEEIADLCNRLQLDPIHIRDVAEDCLL